MAKDTTNSRIPRLDGVTRIPLPDTVRATNPTNIITTATALRSQTHFSQVLRPTSLSGMRPPTALTKNILKKSLSGERISETGKSAIGKRNVKTNKKFTNNKSEKPPSSIPPSANQTKRVENSGKTSKMNTTEILPHTLTRSETFVQEKSDFEQLLDRNNLQSTPLVKSVAKGCDKTQTFSRTYLMDDSRMSQISCNKTELQPPVANQYVGRGKSLNFNLTFENEKQDFVVNNETITLEAVIAKNTTYTNSQNSIENLTLLDDVTMPNFDGDSTLKPSPHSSTAVAEKVPIDLTYNLEKTLLESADRSVVDRTWLHDRDRLVDVTPNHRSLVYMDSHWPGTDRKNTTKLLYHLSPTDSCSSTPDPKQLRDILPPALVGLKGAQSDLALSVQTPDDDDDGKFLDVSEPMEIDGTMSSRTDELLRFDRSVAAASLQELANAANATATAITTTANNLKQRTRFSLGFDFTESTLDCSIDLCDISLSSTVHSSAILANSVPSSLASVMQSPSQPNVLKKQNSFELDESLGILTPDQMKEFLDSTTTNLMNLDSPMPLPLPLQPTKMSFHQMRIDQTPSPEDLPLDPVEVKTDVYEAVLANHLHRQQQQQMIASSANNRQNLAQQQPTTTTTSSCCTETSQTDTETSKTDQMSKSNVSKISTSFITSVTSVTSLDTGYQGDGEMSRPASRGPGDRSPLNCPTQQRKQVSRQPSFNQQNVIAVSRRQDPMTDSDFFTESDADDIFHRGDRRAQVIDGQLYGPQLLQPTTASVFISEQPQLEDSCMESSGIFTDVENRCDDDIAQMRRHEQDVDMSPDNDSTDTVKSMKNGGGGGVDMLHDTTTYSKNTQKQQQQQQKLFDKLDHKMWNSVANVTKNIATTTTSQTSDSVHDSVSCNSDRTSLATDYNPTSTSASNRTSYCGEVAIADIVVANTCNKSFSDEALSEDQHKAFVLEPKPSVSKTTFPVINNEARSNASLLRSNNKINSIAVRKVNAPRKHSSLSSLCTIGDKNENNRNNRSTPAFITAGDSKINLSAPASLLLHRKLQPTTAKSRDAAAFAVKKSIALPRNSPKSGNNNSSSAMVLHRLSTNGNGIGIGTGSKRHLDQENTKNLTAAISLTSLPRTAISADENNRHIPTGSSPNSRKVLPNKWNAVMNKIANNKSHHAKKNYNEVKSKVSTGILTTSRRSPTFSSSGSANNISASVGNGGCSKPTGLSSSSSSPHKSGNGGENCPSSNGLQLPPAKSILQGAAAKRGRSYSKDSQQSSQSDLSFSSGSPKLLAKISLRAAKKRDVRNLSISPTDLGPPPKTQQTTNDPQNSRSKGITTTASITTSQKRISTNAAIQHQQELNQTKSSTAITIAPNINIKGSPPAKKVTISARRGETKSANVAKVPVKDHNRPISLQQSASSKTNSKIINVVDNKTNLTAASQPHSNSAANNQFHSSASVIDKVTSSLLNDNSHPPSSPVLGGKYPANKKITQQTVAISDANKKSLFQQQQQQHQVHPKEENFVIENCTANDLQQEYRLKLFNRYSCNDGSGLDFHSIYRKLLEAEDAARKNKAVESFGVLLQYLVYDLDAFSCPSVKVDCTKAKENLSRTLKLLDEAKSTCHALQDELFEKESFYSTREEELQVLHRAELEKANLKFGELQIQAKEHIDALREQLTIKDAEHRKNLDCYRNELDAKLAQKCTELNAAQQREAELASRIEALTKSEECLREQWQTKEADFASHIQMSMQRERELVDKVNSLNKELERLRQTKEIRERELEDKLNLSKDEISVLRLSQSFNDSTVALPTLNVSHGSPRCNGNGGANSSSSSNGGQSAAANEIQRLQSEAESLRCVLELKQKEISKLAKQNQELIRDADESIALMGKVSTLESSYEMLQTELALKSDKEKELREKYDELKKAYNHEALIRKRLSFDNEALQWQLKQRSEQLHIVEAKLHEQAVLSASKANMSDNSINELNSLNSSLASLSRTNCSDRTQFQMDDLSPPSSPIIKGVIEKIDSVSWVLEMDDETPETAASKIVKRAGSFRSVERSPSTRRQLSMSVGSSASTLNGNASATNGSGTNANGPNPLSQSVSATSVIRQHSNDAAEFLGRAHSRIRSKSVSVKCSEPSAQSASKKISRQNSTGNTRKSDWKEPICSSSPYMRNATVRCRISPTSTDSSSLSGKTTAAAVATTADNIESIYIRQTSNNKKTRHLITCDTSTLNTGEKLEMRSLPTHSSVHDLKVLKKCQEIQESAGEAMVSGTNSEDEGCSASSDEAISTSSTTSGSSTSLNHHQRLRDHHMSIEEVLLLDKIHSLNGTPMEVSWSDDPDQFASESTV